MDTGFTASAEKQLDDVAEANIIWQDVISAFLYEIPSLDRKSWHSQSARNFPGKIAG